MIGLIPALHAVLASESEAVKLERKIRRACRPGPTSLTRCDQRLAGADMPSSAFAGVAAAALVVAVEPLLLRSVAAEAVPPLNPMPTKEMAMALDNNTFRGLRGNCMKVSDWWGYAPSLVGSAADLSDL
jgi:hypothetical protein